jgi:hypothetical protein
MLSDKRHQQVVQEAQALSDPSSPETQALIEHAAELERESPALADAYATQTLRRANYIASRVPPLASNAALSPPPALDPVTDRKVRRTVAAAHDPEAAIERISRMQESPEDVETVRTLFPTMYRAYQAEVQARWGELKKRPSLDARLRISYATGLALDPTVEVGAIQMLQQVARGPDQQRQAEEAAEQKNRAHGLAFKPGPMREADEVYASPLDARLDRR